MVGLETITKRQSKIGDGRNEKIYKRGAIMCLKKANTLIGMTIQPSNKGNFFTLSELENN